MGADEPTTGRAVPTPGEPVYRVTLSGEFDETNSDHLRAELLAGLGRHIEVDCAGVTYLGSVGLAILMDVHQQAVAAGGSLVITAASNIVRTLLDATELTDYLLRPDAG